MNVPVYVTPEMIICMRNASPSFLQRQSPVAYCQPIFFQYQ